MVDVMGRKFKPLFPGEKEEWEGYDFGDEDIWCETCEKEVEIETLLHNYGLANHCMECGSIIE